MQNNTRTIGRAYNVSALAAITNIREVLTIGNNRVPYQYVYHDGVLYIPEMMTMCPYTATFTLHKATIQQLDTEYCRFQGQSAIAAANPNLNTNSHTIIFAPGDVVVVGCPYGDDGAQRATFIVDKALTVSAQYPADREVSVSELMAQCIALYPRELLGRGSIRRQVREFAGDAAQKMTGALVILSCIVILLTSYYNAYKIIVGK